MTQVYDIITIQNIDDEDFEFQYNASEGGTPYVIPAGDVARYPAFLAKHATKHLIDKILTKSGERTNHPVKRTELMEKIVVGSEKITHKAEPSETEALRSKVKDLNAPSTLESILKKREEAAEKVEREIGNKPNMDKEPEGEEEEEEFEGLPKDEKTVVKEDKKDKKVVAKPTRSELMDYASKQNLVLDEEDKDGKTLRDKLSKMKIDDVIKELDYPLEEE